MQVDWLRQMLGSNESIVVKTVIWAGIEDVPQKAGPMETVMRSKCLLLFAVTMKRRAVR